MVTFQNFVYRDKLLLLYQIRYYPLLILEVKIEKSLISSAKIPIKIFLYNHNLYLLFYN